MMNRNDPQTQQPSTEQRKAVKTVTQIQNATTAIGFALSSVPLAAVLASVGGLVASMSSARQALAVKEKSHASQADKKTLMLSKNNS